EAAAASFPLVSHGVSLSVGGTDPLDMTYLKSLKELLDRFDVPWWSDHLCFSSANGRSTHDLLPLPWTKEAVDHIVLRARQVQEFVGRPFLLENISFYMEMPCAQMSEAQFFAEILEKADCGMLLDVNNVYVNSVNHGFDPVEYLKQLPLERVVQIHVAGHLVHDRHIIDTHGASIVEPAYQLLAEVLKRVKVNAILLERDQNVPEFDELLAELATIRKIADDRMATRDNANLPEARAPIVIAAERIKRQRSKKKRASGQEKQIPLKELESEFCDLLLDRKKQARNLGRKKGVAAASIRPAWLRSLVDGEGAATYVWMVDSHQKNLVGNIYPLCRNVLGRSWHRVVDDYFVHFPPGNLNFRDFGEHLAQYFAGAGRQWTKKYPFLPALAEFEWAKVLVSDSPAESTLTETIAFA